MNRAARAREWHHRLELLAARRHWTSLDNPLETVIWRRAISFTMSPPISVSAYPFLA